MEEANNRHYPCDEAENKRSYPCDEAENKRSYPCDEADKKRSYTCDEVGNNRNYPCDEAENKKNYPCDATENGVEVKGKGKRGGNSGFSVVKHSGIFKERPGRRDSGDRGNFEGRRDSGDRGNFEGRRDSGDRGGFEGRRDSGDFGSFGGRADRENYKDFGSRRDNGTRGNSDSRDERRSFRDFDSRDERRGFRNSDSRDERRIRGNFDNNGGHGNYRDFGKKNFSGKGHGDAFGGYSSVMQDFSDPVMLYVTDVNDYGAFVELPEGALKTKISGVTVGGNYIERTLEYGRGTDSRNGNSERLQRVLVPFAEQVGRPVVGDMIRVRFYADKGGRLTATMREPKLRDGEVGILKVADVTRIGVFLDNGVPKQVLLPFKEQIETPEVGDEVLVYLYRDKSGRQAASMRVYKHLDKNCPYKEDDKVTGFVYEINKELGVFVAIDNKYYGMIPIHETFKEYAYGDKIEARVSRVRDDGKLDLLVREKLYLSVEQDADAILYELRRNNGFLPYGDRADAEFIEETYAMSKNQFKRALGHLYKNHVVELDREHDTVKLL